MSRLWVLVIDGLASPEGELSVLTSAAVDSGLLAEIATAFSAASAVAVPVLPYAIRFPAAALDLLDAVSSDAGFTVTVPATDAVRALLDRDYPDITTSSTGYLVTLAENLDDSETAVDVTDGAPFASGLPKWRWIGGECIKVTSRSSNTLTVSRGQCGTRAEPHEYAPERPKPLTEGPPILVGARCRLYQGLVSDTSFSSLTLRYTGTMGETSVGSNELMTIPIDSTWSRLRVPMGVQLAESSTGVFRNADGTFDVRQVNVPSDKYADADGWVAAVWGTKDVWIAFALGTPTTMILGGPLADAAEYSVYPAQTGVRPLAFGRYGEVASALAVIDIPEVLSSVARRADAFINTADRSLSEVVLALMTGATSAGTFSPAGSASTLPSASIDVDSLLLLDDAIGTLVLNNAVGATAAFVLPPQGVPREPVQLLSVIANILRSLGLGAVVDATGRIKIIDWRERLVADATITDETMRAAWYSGRRTASSVVSRVIVTSDPLQTVWDHRSVFASVQHGSGRTVEIDAGMWGPHAEAVAARWLHQLLPAHERAVRTLELHLTAELALDAGDTVAIEPDRIPGHNGSITRTDPVGGKSATVSPLGRVMSVAGNADDSQDVTVFVHAQSGTGATWAPTGRVSTGYAAGTTTFALDANVFTDPGRTPATDAAAFGDYAGALLWLLDQHGTRKDDNAPALVSRSGHSLTIDAAFELSASAIALAEGDFVVLAPYTAQPSGVRALTAGYMADATATLGSSEARKYE